MKIKATLLLIFAAATLCFSQAPPEKQVPEKRFTVSFTMQEWTSIVQTIKDSNIPMDKGIAIITAFNTQIEQQLKDTILKKEKK